MKYRLLWTHAATATVSFAFCWAFTHKSNPSLGAATTAAQSANSSSSISSSNQSDASEETTVRTRVAKRDEKKKPSEPGVSLPMATIAETLRNKLSNFADIETLKREMASSLMLLGTSEREKNDVLELLNKAEIELHAEERKLIKVVQTDASEIRLDNRAMEGSSKKICLQMQDGIRASLRADLAEVLISATEWDRIYPTGEKTSPVFTIRQAGAGVLYQVIGNSTGSTATQVNSKFNDDGKAIPADEVFQDSRWKPFLKGLTLLPKDEE